MRKFNYEEDEYYETVVEERNDWIKEALCRNLQLDPAIFYDEVKHSENKAEAKRCCFSCPVQKECAEYAIVTREEYGIWGGLEFFQRRVIKRRWRNGTRAQLRKLIETYGPTTSSKVSRKKTEKS